MIRARLSSGLQQSVRALANKLTQAHWRPLAAPPSQGRKPPEVAKGTPASDAAGTLT